jgi:serine/threonine protein kinase
MGNFHEPAPPELPAGYLALRRLGRGTFGEVWEAEAPGGVKVAVKIIARRLRPEDARRELEALQLMKGLRHQGLVALQAYFTLEDQLVIVQELADCSLRDRLRACLDAGLHGIPADELLRYSEHAAEALDFLHQHHVLHRDIKSENVLLLGRYAKLADFGLALVLQNATLQSASSVGTPAYMAPETWQGKASVHGDQYSLAVMYSELRLGRFPFTFSGLADLMNAHLCRPPELGALPPAEQRVLHRALAKNPGERFPSCSVFVSALAEALGHAGVVGFRRATAGTGPGSGSFPEGAGAPSSSFNIHVPSDYPPAPGGPPSNPERETSVAEQETIVPPSGPRPRPQRLPWVPALSVAAVVACALMWLIYARYVSPGGDPRPTTSASAVAVATTGVAPKTTVKKPPPKTGPRTVTPVTTRKAEPPPVRATAPDALLIGNDQADAFAGAVVERLKVEGNLPPKVTLDVGYERFPSRPVAFADRALEDALVRLGIKEITDGQDDIVRVRLVETDSMIDGITPRQIKIPRYDLRGEVKGRGLEPLRISASIGPAIEGRQPQGPANGSGDNLVVARLTAAQQRGIRERFNARNADNLEEERALVQGIHVDCTLAGSIGDAGTPLHKLLSDRRDQPSTHLEGSKVFAARGSVYAVEVYLGELVRDGQALRVQVKGPALVPVIDSRKFARIDVKPGAIVVLRLYNLDREEASARVTLDTLDSFAFSSEPARHNGGQRWLLPKGGHGDVGGWYHRSGQTLPLILGPEGEIDAGATAETQRQREMLSPEARGQLQKIASFKNARHGGQISVSFRKVWPDGAQAPADEASVPAPSVIPGKEFDQRLQEVRRERGAFRASVAIRYGDWDYK